MARGIATDALPSDAIVRAELERELLERGLNPLVDRLRVIAPERAAGVDTRNPRRVVRALEIATLDGGQGSLPKPRGYLGQSAWIGLDLDRATHRDWIAARARVRKAAVTRCGPAFTAIGYREAWAVLDGRLTRDEAIAEDARRNVAFAKRQRTWFRIEPDITWLDPTDRGALDAALARARRLVG